MCKVYLPSPEVSEELEDKRDLIDLVRMMPAPADIRIRGSYFTEDPVRRCAAEATIPRQYSISPKHPDLTPETRERRQLLYHRVLQNYRNKHRLAQAVLRFLSAYQWWFPEATTVLLQTRACRPPGLITPRRPDDPGLELLKQRSCGLTWICPFCRFRRMLRVKSPHGDAGRSPGPAYEMAWALAHGYALHGVSFYITGWGFEIPRRFREALAQRVTRTLKAPAYWMRLEPYFASVDTTPRRYECAKPQGHWLKLVMAGADGGALMRGWRSFDRHWQNFYVKPSIRKSPFPRLLPALKHLAGYDRKLNSPYTEVAAIDGFIQYTPYPDPYRVFTRACRVEPASPEALSRVATEPAWTAEPRREPVGVTAC